MSTIYDYVKAIHQLLCTQNNAKDPEIVCATNDGGETIIKLIALIDGITGAVTLTDFSGVAVSGYTVVPCKTSQGVIVGDPWCWSGTTILPFFDVETDGSASATVAFWFNPVTNAVVVPDGSQVPGVCLNATPTESITTNDCAGTDIIANIPQDRVVYTKPVKGILQSTKDCNSDTSLATLQDIKINGDQSNTNELVANIELAAINANTDQVETLLNNTITELNDTQTLLQSEFDETQVILNNLRDTETIVQEYCDNGVSRHFVFKRQDKLVDGVQTLDWIVTHEVTATGLTPIASLPLGLTVGSCPVVSTPVLQDYPVRIIIPSATSLSFVTADQWKSISFLVIGSNSTIDTVHNGANTILLDGESGSFVATGNKYLDQEIRFNTGPTDMIIINAIKAN